MYVYKVFFLEKEQERSYTGGFVFWYWYDEKNGDGESR